MRYAIFSDIHGNLEAWNRVLEDIQALEADVLICLGDVVGYGPKPDEGVEWNPSRDRQFRDGKPRCGRGRRD